MIDGSELPDAVKLALGQLVDSLDLLEVLLLLHRHPEKPWTAADVAASLGITEKAAATLLGKLRARQVAVAEDDEAFRYGPADGLGEKVTLIADTYGTRRIALINYVATGALQRIRELADAFRLGKGKKDG